MNKEGSKLYAEHLISGLDRKEPCAMDYLSVALYLIMFIIIMSNPSSWLSLFLATIWTVMKFIVFLAISTFFIAKTVGVYLLNMTKHSLSSSEKRFYIEDCVSAYHEFHLSKKSWILRLSDIVMTGIVGMYLYHVGAGLIAYLGMPLYSLAIALLVINVVGKKIMKKCMEV